MKNREIKDRLRQAVLHATPEVLDGILSADKKGTVVKMAEKKMHKKIWIPIVSAAAAVVLVVGSVFGYNAYAYNRVDSVIGLDVNPSIELKVNRDEKVLRVESLNDDAAKILDGMELKGTDLDVAMNALIGSLLKNGYIDELANSILVSVENGDAEKSAALQKQLTDEIEQLLGAQKIDGAVLCQGIGNDAELQKLAEANNISLGKARLISQIVKKNPLIKFEDAAKLSINQLNLLAKSQKMALDDISSTGDASDKAYIGSDKAMEVALQRAGVKAVAASSMKVELGLEDGVMVYEVEFMSQGYEYEVDVDALKGIVLDYDVEKKGNGNGSGNGGGNTPNTSEPTVSGNTSGTVSTKPNGNGGSGNGNGNGNGQAEFIGKSRAKEIAFQHAGVIQADARKIKVEFDTDDGTPEYEVEFIAGNVEYEYTIDARTGKILEYDSETKANEAVPSKPSTVSKPAAVTSKPAETTSAAAYIPEAEAKRIALSNAGLAEGDIKKYEIDFDHDDGVPVYEIEFVSGKIEYSYEIHAQTGKILESEKETDD